MGPCLWRGALAALALACGARGNPAIAQVQNMLNNIISMLETEAQTDEQEHAKFVTWSNSERAAVQTEVGSLQDNVETTTAALSALNAQKGSLSAEVTRLAGELEREESQVSQATERRREETTQFGLDQQNFDSAIEACTRATQLMAAHYGEGGGGGPAARPQFMSLVDGYVKKARGIAKSIAKKHSKVAGLIQNPMFDAYQESGAEAGSIVDQIRELSETFAEDKQSAIEQEEQLQRAFETLTRQKAELIATLGSQKDAQQGQLNEVNQGVAENEGALQMSTETMQDQQKYLSGLNAQHQAAVSAFDSRVADRRAETAAVRQALQVLDQAPSFLQLAARRAHRGAVALAADHDGGEAAWAARLERRAHGQGHLRRVGGTPCPRCVKAATLLRQRASLYHSEVLTSAAATALGNDAIDDVITQLGNTLLQLKNDQETEREHKAWCEAETRRTNMKKTTHEHAVDEIQADVNSLTELVSMKGTAVSQRTKEISAEETSFKELESIRNTDREEYQEDLQDNQDAIAALNEAIQILTKFYAEKNGAALAQLARAGGRTDPKNGPEVVKMMSDVRAQFEHAEAELRTNEQEAVDEFNRARELHNAADADLHHNRDVVTVEKQTAEQGLEQKDGDLHSNQEEIGSSKEYLARLGGSCNPLIQNYDQRRKLRGEEKTALEDAIRVLREA